MDSLINNHRGVFIISAPSGAGKTSLCMALLKSNPNIDVAISHTTRNPREGEVHGEQYYFVDTVEFEKMIEDNGFLEYANVYGNYYGTSTMTISNCLKQNKQVILEIDWQGAQKVRARAPGVQSIFILPPSYQSLESRLVDRGKDNRSTIDKRLSAAMEDIRHSHEYDFVIVNDDFEQALQMLKDIFSGKGSGSDFESVHSVLNGFEASLPSQDGCR